MIATTVAAGPPVQRPRGAVRLTPLALLPLLGLWIWYVLAYNPTDRIANPSGPCLWHRLFGVDGPTCGITRMSWYLLHGDLLDAARMHLAGFIAVPVGVYGYLWWAGGWIIGARLPMARITKWTGIGYAVFFLVYSTVLRQMVARAVRLSRPRRRGLWWPAGLGS